MASLQGDLYRPSHVTLSDLSSATSAFRSLVHYVDDPFYCHQAPQTEKNDEDHKAEHAPVHRRHHHHNMVAPYFDVRDTKSCFFLEGEFPGISDKNDIIIEKVGPRSLAIEAKLPKVNLHDEWGSEPRAGLFRQFDKETLGQAEDTSQEMSGIEEPESTSVPEGASASEDKDKGQEIVTELEARDTVRAPSWIQMDETSTSAHHEEGVRTWISERHVGLLGRSFTFPIPVDFPYLKARLRDGLLCIMIPKSEKKEPERQRIPISD